MHTYRIGQAKYAYDLAGSGIDARWNFLGSYVIYTGGSLALSCLEKLAHTPGASLYSGNFSVTIFEVPNGLKMKEISIAELIKINPDWTKTINYPMTQNIGNKWLREREAAILKVPSAIIDLEYNYLLNPAHHDFKRIKIIAVNKFTFDSRLKV